MKSEAATPNPPAHPPPAAAGEAATGPAPGPPLSGERARRRPFARRGRLVILAVIVALVAVEARAAGTRIWASYHLRAARAEMARYHNRQAVAHLSRCGAVWPDDPEVLLLSARAARRAGEFEQAEKLLARCQKATRFEDAVALEHVLLRASQGDVDGVEPYCRALLERNDPATPLVLEALALGCLETARTGPATFYLNAWLKREPDNPEALRLRGGLNAYLQDYPPALADLRRALALDPDHEAARLALADLYVTLNQPAEAIPHLEYLRGRWPEGLRVRALLAHCLIEVNRAAEAEALLTGVLAEDPNYAPALADLGRLANRAGKPEQAEKLLTRALARSLDHPTYYQLFLSLQGQGKTAEAEQAQKRLRLLEEDLARIRQILTGGRGQALDNPDLLQELGARFLRTGNVRDGLRCLHGALAAAPNHAATHATLADYYDRLGQLGRAARHRTLAGGASGRPPQP